MAVKGSLVKRAHLFEKLSDARLAMIDACIAGKCGVDHDETSTKCLVSAWAAAVVTCTSRRARRWGEASRRSGTFAASNAA